MSQPTDTPAIEGVGLTKSFGSTRALRDVSLAIKPGECLGLVGRNGAGKSTIVSLLTGLRRPDDGQVRFGGRPAPPVGAPAAWRERVACVYQHSMLVPTLTVAENVFLNRQPRRSRRAVNWPRMRREAGRVLRDWGVDIDVGVDASNISVEQRQVVEIARALSMGTRCLILDEPTAAIESSGVRRLFDRIRTLLEQDVAVLYISHHLEEVYEICHRVMVVRDGAHVRTAPTRDIDQDQLVTAMIGDAASAPADDDTRTDEPSAARGAPVLQTRGVSARTPRGRLDDVDIDVHGGECLGLLGLRGSGTTVLADVIAGLIRPTTGQVLVDGRVLPPGRPDIALRRGVGYVPEDRHARGFVPVLGVGENITMSIADRLRRHGLLSPRRRNEEGRAQADRLAVVSAGPSQPVGELSGGNQQKVVVGRALAAKPAVVVAVGPTQGVDVASKESLLGALDSARRRGAGVLLVSDDLDELRIATRIVVVVRGRTFTEFRRPPWDREALIAASEGLGERDHDHGPHGRASA